MTSDALAQARQHLTTAIFEYRDTKAALKAASERAAQASVGRDILARRRTFKTLEELGTKSRLAERVLAQTVRIVRQSLPAKDIEAIALKLGTAEQGETIVALVRTVLTERKRAIA